MILTFSITALFFLFFPGEALAWGIGVHLQLGSRILENLGILKPELQSLLRAFPHDYLYGCISADITLGKKFTHYIQHCHSWRVGFRVFEAAQTPPQKACAYGYLAHLAADSVAHSYFVPFKMVRTFNTSLLKHAYWELRVEACVDPQIWKLARSIAGRKFPENDAMMRSVLSDTLFSFATNKRLFNSLLLLNRLEHWQKMIRTISTASKWSLPTENLKEYLALSGDAVASVLTDIETSPYLTADPTGERALNAAKMIRKNLNLLWLDGKLLEDDANLILHDLRFRFRRGITNPDHLLEMSSSY